MVHGRPGADRRCRACRVYGHRQWTKPDPTITPGEATVDLADTAGQQLANALRGVWSIRFDGARIGFDDLPLHGLELFLDVAQRGRGLRGYLDSAQRLRGDEEPRYRIIGDLAQGKPAELYWRLIDSRAADGAPTYELAVVLDEVWADFGNAGSGTISGRIVRLDRPLGLPEQDNRFVAHKLLFPEARQRIGLNPTLLAWLISPEHRLFHQLWHASRDKWHTLPEDKREALRGIGWQPGPRGKERMRAGRAKIAMARASTFFHAPAHAWYGALDAGLAVVAGLPDAAAGA